MYICIYIYTYIHIYIHICILNVYTYIHICILNYKSIDHETCSTNRHKSSAIFLREILNHLEGW